MLADNQTGFADGSLRKENGDGGGIRRRGPMQLRAPHCPSRREPEKEAVIGQLHSLAVGVYAIAQCGHERERGAETFGSVSVSVCIYAVSQHGSHRCFTTPPPGGSGAWQMYIVQCFKDPPFISKPVTSY